MAYKYNKELLEMQDPKILEIARLKQTIKAFKKYDEERKKFIQKLQYELEDVSEEYLALKATISKDVLEVKEQYKQRIKGLKTAIRGQNKRINDLQHIIGLMKNPDRLARAEEALKNYTVVELKTLNDSLKQQVKSLRNNNSELMTKLMKLESINTK